MTNWSLQDAKNKFSAVVGDSPRSSSWQWTSASAAWRRCPASTTSAESHSLLSLLTPGGSGHRLRRLLGEADVRGLQLQAEGRAMTRSEPSENAVPSALPGFG